MIRSWQEAFEPYPLPEWLRSFAQDPKQALDDLLWNKVFWGHLQGAAPEDLLTDWTIRLENEGGFQDQLDEVLCQWVQAHWGHHDQARPRLVAETWSRLADIVRSTGVCNRAAKALLDRFPERNEFLGSLYLGPSCDPLWHFLLTVAEAQALATDPGVSTSLTAFWWRICGLPPVVPIHHGPVGLIGLRRRVLDKDQDSGGFREEVARGLVKLAMALERRIHPRELSKKRAREIFLSVGRLQLAAYPFPERWLDLLQQELPFVPRVTRLWLGELVPSLPSAPSAPSARKTNPRSFPEAWPQKREQTLDHLAKQTRRGTELADELLAEQRRWAELHGETGALTRTLCQFARASVWSRPDRAARWAREAMVWEPWNDFVWSTLIRARSFSEGAWAALPMAREALERFPENPYIRSAAAAILTELGHLDQAEALGREIIEVFPRHSMGWTGLATTLGKAERHNEAEALLAEGLTHFPQDLHLRTRLGVVLRRLGRAADAEEIYRDLLAHHGDSEFALSGLGAALREQGALADAEAMYARAIEKFPGNPYAWGGMAKVLAEAGRREEAIEQYRQTTRKFPKFLDGWLSFSEVVCRDPTESELCPEIRSHTEQLQWELRPPLSEIETRLASSWRSQSGEARFLRRWARRTEAQKASGSATELRHRAESLLATAIAGEPDDPSILTQQGLLLLESGQIEESRNLLALKSNRFFAAPTLLAAFARASREEAHARHRRLDEPGAIESLLEPSERLKGLGSVYEPLVHLQEGRAFLALSDGHSRLQGAGRSFDRLNRWAQAKINDPQAIDFEKWWANQIRAAVFPELEGRKDFGGDDVLAIDQQLLDTGFHVDGLEEDFSYRMSWASAS